MTPATLEPLSIETQGKNRCFYEISGFFTFFCLLRRFVPVKSRANHGNGQDFCVFPQIAPLTGGLWFCRLCPVIKLVRHKNLLVVVVVSDGAAGACRA
jgi:hypothetical protein